MNYTLLVTAVGFLQVLLLVRQMEACSTPTLASRVSLLMLAHQVRVGVGAPARAPEGPAAGAARGAGCVCALGLRLLHAVRRLPAGAPHGAPMLCPPIARLTLLSPWLGCPPSIHATFRAIMQAVLDAYLCLVHLTLGILIESLFHSFGSVAFMQFGE